MKPKPKRKRKPRLEGWECFHDTIWNTGAGVLHKKSGRWWVGTKKLKSIGKFFIAAAEYFEGREK
jgi:hypothetical protein